MTCSPGLAERWGKTVVICPYCDGFEIGGGSIGVLATGPMPADYASLIADWGEVTLFTDGKVTLDESTHAMLRRRRVAVEAVPVKQLEGTAPALDGVRLEDGRLVPVRALFVRSAAKMASSLAADLGCALDDTPLGPVVRTDASKETTVSRIFAAGDMARAPSNISFAIGDGVMAGIGLHRSLVAEDCSEAATC